MPNQVGASLALGTLRQLNEFYRGIVYDQRISILVMILFWSSIVATYWLDHF